MHRPNPCRIRTNKLQLVLVFPPEPASMSLSVEITNTKNSMSEYESLIKQYEALTRLNDGFSNELLLEALEERLELLEEDMELSLC